MAIDMFLTFELPGLPGESQDDKHQAWIEVLSFSFGASQKSAGERSTGGAASAERVSMQDFSIVKALDKASPKLFLKCCTGEHFGLVTLVLCRATGDKSKYMEYKMRDVLVTSVRKGGAAQGGEGLPLEEVGFNFGKIELTYTETDRKTGKRKGDVKSNWDLVGNKGG
jgi:type VI secretion system secreted protein Hcp